MSEILQHLNSTLAPLERELIKSFTATRYRPLFIVGAPRSGHTYFSQLVAATRRFTYITNFTARYWMAPVLADRMQHASELHSDVGTDSKFGRTDGHSGPHEGGNFLRRFIHFSNTHIADRAPTSEEIAIWQQEVAALEAEHDRPVMLRNVIYGLNLNHVLTAFPNAVVAICTRERRSHIGSILRSREAHGGRDKWWSARPDDINELSKLSPEDQVSGQIDSCYRLIKSADRLGISATFIEIRQEDVLSNPDTALAKLIG